MGAWRPLIEDPVRRAELLGVIREIVAGTSTAAPGPRPLTEISDRALLRAYLAQDSAVDDPDDVTGSSLAEAVTLFARGGTGMGLFGGGAAGTGWLVEHLAGGDTADGVCTTIDRALLAQLQDWSHDYDLVSGLVGIGVYGLERGEAGQPVVSRVLDELARTGRERHGGIAWPTPVELLPVWQRELAPAGYWNLGLAHGNPGVIGLLARCVRHGVEAERAGTLLDAAVTHLLAAEPRSGAGGRFPSWHRTDSAVPLAPSPRLAWCYGDLGVSLALYAAAVVRDREDWRSEALALARRCAATSTDDAEVYEGALCHGAAGSMHLFARLFHASGDTVFRDASLRWLDRLFELRNDQSIAGFPAKNPSSDPEWIADASLVAGAVGVALAIHALVSEVEPSWDRLLLVDL